MVTTSDDKMKHECIYEVSRFAVEVEDVLILSRAFSFSINHQAPS